jgi:hypothetical protein
VRVLLVHSCKPQLACCRATAQQTERPVVWRLVECSQMQDEGMPCSVLLLPNRQPLIHAELIAHR